ncbi:hypothetical protein NPJ88_000115 [Halomonas elongata]|uniref:hypothetical protein n=1 Tax=Halomonas elongata TaxID=2746 RepID=UPI00255B2421|nr:hypothetical protein [Halomonas elongata]MDL4860726.1 hypothetical protein [Halomonas elongata]
MQRFRDKELAESLGIPEPTGEALALLKQGFENSKAGILADMERGEIPRDVSDYDDLKMYVDQPGEYSGLNTDDAMREGVRLFPPLDEGMGDYVHFTSARIIMSQWLHEWLASRPGEKPHC